jgi:hypothetical protein
MTINKDQIIEMTKKILRHQEGLEDRTIMHPVREWFVGLAIGIVVFIAVALMSGYAYWQNKQENVTFETEVAETTIYSESQVKEALRLYRTRDRERMSLIGGIEVTEIPVTEQATTTATTTPLEEATSTATSS